MEIGKPHKVTRPSRRSNKSKSRVPTFLPIPQERVVLGIDPGETAGWSIFANGIYIESGASKRSRIKYYAVQTALSLSKCNHTSLIIVAEKWNKPFLPDRKRMSYESVLGMGMNWGMWLQEIYTRISDDFKNIYRINTLHWRKFYGLQRCNRNQAKTMAIPIASDIACHAIGDHNEAEAILIGKVGCYLELK